MVFVVVAAVFAVWPGWTGLLALPGLALLCLNGIWAGLLLGIVSARFRDVPPIITSVVRICFFVTPIIWTPELLPARTLVLDANPFFHLVEVVRAPLLGQMPGLASWIAVLVYDGRRLARDLRVLPPLQAADRILGLSAVVSLQLEAVTVDFPVYSAGARSLKKRLLHQRHGRAHRAWRRQPPSGARARGCESRLETR